MRLVVVLILLATSSAAAGEPLPTTFHTLGRALGVTHAGATLGGSWFTQNDSDGTIVDTQGYRADLHGELAHGVWGGSIELPIYVAKLGHTYLGAGPPRLEGYRRFDVPRGMLLARARVRLPVESFPDLENYDNPRMLFYSTYAQRVLERGQGDHLGLGVAATLRQHIGPVDVQADLQIDGEPAADETGPYVGLGLGVAYRLGDVAVRGELAVFGLPLSDGNGLGTEGSDELDDRSVLTGALGVEWRLPSCSLGLSVVNPLDRYLRAHLHIVGVSVVIPWPG